MSRSTLRPLAIVPLLFAPLLVPSAAAQEGCDSVTVLVTYYSRTGSTEQLAEKARDGAASVAGAKVVLKPVADVTREDLESADGILIGSPTYYANVAGPVKTFIDDWGLRYRVFLGDRVGGAFATGAGEGGGKEHTVMSLVLAMLANGMIVVGPTYPEKGYGGFGAASTTGSATEPVPSESGLQTAFDLGKRVASVAKSLCRMPG